MTKETETKGQKPSHYAYFVPDKGPWAKIGAAWPHKDGEGFAISLDLIPVGTGFITLRTPKTEEKAEESAGVGQ